MKAMCAGDACRNIAVNRRHHSPRSRPAVWIAPKRIASCVESTRPVSLPATTV